MKKPRYKAETKKADGITKDHFGCTYHYCHYPKQKAEARYDLSLKQKYIVTTICWVSGEVSGVEYPDMVHKNEYRMTIPEFMTWAQIYGLHAETVIEIKKAKKEIGEEYTVQRRQLQRCPSNGMAQYRDG